MWSCVFLFFFFKSFLYFLRSRQSSYEGLGIGSDHGFKWIKCFSAITLACQPSFPQICQKASGFLCYETFCTTVLTGPFPSSRQVAS